MCTKTVPMSSAISIPGVPCISLERDRLGRRLMPALNPRRDSTTCSKSGATTARSECAPAVCAGAGGRGRAGPSGQVRKPTSGAPIMTFSSKANVMQRTVTAQLLAGSVRSRVWLSTLCLLLLCASCMQAQHTVGPGAGTPIYETRAEHHPDGIGKFYMGREIAQVMGVPGAEWLPLPDGGAAGRPPQGIEHITHKTT